MERVYSNAVVLWDMIDGSAHGGFPKSPDTCFDFLRSQMSRHLKADHPLFDWLINCVISNHF